MAMAALERGRRRLPLVVAFLVALAIFAGRSAPARALGSQIEVGLAGFWFATPESLSEGSYGPAVHLGLLFGLDENWKLGFITRGGLDVENRDFQGLFQFSLEVRHEWTGPPITPYAAFGVGMALGVMSQATRIEDLVPDPTAHLGFGVDFHLGEEITLGVAARYFFVFLQPADTVGPLDVLIQVAFGI